MSGESGEKTEKPTAKRRKESRKEGQVPRTQELGAWSSLLLVVLVLPSLLGHEIGQLRELSIHSFALAGEATPAKALDLLAEGTLHALWSLVLLGSGVMVVGVACAVAQGGFFVASKSAKPSFKKFNLINGAKRIFGPQSWWEGAKMLLKSSLVVIMVYAAVRALMPLLGQRLSISMVLDETSARALSMLRTVAGLGVLMAAFDYVMQRRRIGKQTRMSKHEVRQEHKQSEGDPLLKGAMRSRQLTNSRNRMIADVATADVVLVNPTHVAVALRYERRHGAPRVVARGAGHVAARIREAAREGRVPLVRDVPLARALYTSTRTGQEIPAELFGAVAQILAFVISRRTMGQAAGEYRTPRPDEPLPDVPRARHRQNRSTPPPDGR